MLAQDRQIGQWNKTEGMTEYDKVSNYLGKKSYTSHTFTKK